MSDFIPAAMTAACLLDVLYDVAAAALADAVGDEQQADEHLLAAHARLEAIVA